MASLHYSVLRGQSVSLKSAVTINPDTSLVQRHNSIPRPLLCACTRSSMYRCFHCHCHACFIEIRMYNHSHILTLRFHLISYRLFKYHLRSLKNTTLTLCVPVRRPLSSVNEGGEGFESTQYVPQDRRACPYRTRIHGLPARLHGSICPVH